MGVVYADARVLLVWVGVKVGDVPVEEGRVLGLVGLEVGQLEAGGGYEKAGGGKLGEGGDGDGDVF